MLRPDGPPEPLPFPGAATVGESAPAETDPTEPVDWGELVGTDTDPANENPAKLEFVVLEEVETLSCVGLTVAEASRAPLFESVVDAPLVAWGSLG